MTTIDVHFHVVPFGFLEALHRDDFRAAVEVETLPDRDVLLFHAPQGTAVEPNVLVRPHQYDASILLRAMDARRLDAAAVSPPPELFLYWAKLDLGERIARIMNDGMAQLARAHRTGSCPSPLLQCRIPIERCTNCIGP
jgi:aminocarboxymuconate-semialdehyde decarboxylase